MTIFILEDDQARIDEFVRQWGTRAKLTIAKSYDEAVKKYKGDYDLICLDHDLGGRQYVDHTDPNTGYHFVTWLTKKHPFMGVDGRYVPSVIIHSYNPDGATKMGQALMGAGWYLVQLLPFGPQMFKAVTLPGEDGWV